MKYKKSVLQVFFLNVYEAYESSSQAYNRLIIIKSLIFYMFDDNCISKCKCFLFQEHVFLVKHLSVKKNFVHKIKETEMCE